MRHSFVPGTVFTLSISAFLLQAQPPRPTGPQGIPPRAAASDYQAQGKAGEVTIAAEFTGHALPAGDSPLNSEDYIGVEVALFGPDGAKLKISIEDFSLRLNAKKQASASQAFGLTFRSLKDPEYQPPEAPAEKKSKGGVSTGGGGGQGDPPPSPPPVPIEVRRSWQQRIQKSALPEGERTLPQGGLLFYQHRGKVASVELIYNGPAGKCTLTLAP